MVWTLRTTVLPVTSFGSNQAFLPHAAAILQGVSRFFTTVVLLMNLSLVFKLWRQSDSNAASATGRISVQDDKGRARLTTN